MSEVTLRDLVDEADDLVDFAMLVSMAHEQQSHDPSDQRVEQALQQGASDLAARVRRLYERLARVHELQRTQS